MSMSTQAPASNPPDVAEHDGCGGELVVPQTADGRNFGPPANHPLAGNPAAYMVTCDECATVNWSTDPQLYAMARKRGQRFVVEAVR